MQTYTRAPIPLPLITPLPLSASPFSATFSNYPCFYL
jgi:hypothetical protein